MKKQFTFLLLLLIIATTQAQTLGKLSIKKAGYNQKKFNHTGKKIYVKYFNINYQTVMIGYAKAKKGTNFGSATAGLALGLDGIDQEQFQKMTDQYYNEFVSQLKQKGFTIVTAEEVSKNENYSDLEINTGGTPTMDVIADGYLTTTPTGKTFLNHKYNLFSNIGNLPDSKKLGGIIVAGVNLVIPFTETREINGGPVGGVAKITAKCDLRISPSETLPVKGNFKKPKIVTTSVTFGYKESLKWQAFSHAKLTKAIEIEGVLDENKKYKSTSVSTTGSGLTSRYSKAYSKNAISVPCDPTKYEKGVGMAIQKYLDTAVSNFTSAIN